MYCTANPSPKTDRPLYSLFEVQESLLHSILPIMAAALVNQVEASSRVLASLSHVDIGAHDRVAAVQRGQLEAGFAQGIGLTIEDVATLTDAISASAFPEEHRNGLLTAVCSLPVVAGGGGPKDDDW